MNTVKSENVLRVIQNLEKVLPYASRPRSLNMSCSYVKDEIHSCGTIHCHAGWYLLSLNIGKWDTLPESTYFLEGVVAIADHLGLKSIEKVLNWAKNNPDVWGNNRGGYMFSSAYAFISSARPKAAKNLQDIIDHWKDVYNRLVALENSQKPMYINITKELAILPTEERADVAVHLNTRLGYATVQHELTRRHGLAANCWDSLFILKHLV